MGDEVEPIPLELLNDSITIQPTDGEKLKQDSWGTEPDSDSGANTVVINHVRLQPVTNINAADSGALVIAGTYRLFVDAVNSGPLDVLPRLNDRVLVQSTQQQLIVKNFDPIYDFGTHIHHWEGVLQ